MLPFSRSWVGAVAPYGKQNTENENALLIGGASAIRSGIRLLDFLPINRLGAQFELFCSTSNTRNTRKYIRNTLLVQLIPCMCVFSSHPFWTSSSLDVPAGVTQEEGHTGFLIHLPSAVRALIFVARRIQPFLSLVDREVEFCVLTS